MNAPAPSADAPPRLVVVTDTTVAPGQSLVERVAVVVTRARPGTVIVQLRDRELPVRERLALGGELRALCAAHGQRFVVNDRLDLAVLLGADGVHLGERSVSVEDARRVLPRSHISVAAHSPGAAARSGADAILLSPIVAPRKGQSALGVGALTEVRGLTAAAGARRPALYALGGVDAASASLCLDAGADGVAVIGAALDGRDPGPLLAVLGIG